ncbi:MAG: DUF1573 domain-containing protein [Bacteroidales bacterium]|nr:DUF1573 domain-containing protein [Bacteroidales bacterium]
MKLLLFLFTAVLLQSPTVEQESNDNRVVFDKTIHDFGDFRIDDGPKSHTFTFTNKWDKPIVIQTVVSSCGCAAPEWTRAPVKPGEKGTIKVTFSNDQGPYPFDKSLAVYIAGFPRPYVLRIRGVVHRKKVSITQTHPVVMGSLRLRRQLLEMGQINQGATKTDSIEIINTGKKPVFLKAISNHPNLVLQLPGTRLDPKERGFIRYTIDTKNKEEWGDVIYHAQLILNDKKDPLHVVTVKASVKMNTAGLTAADKKRAPLPQMSKSAIDFNVASAGSPIRADFVLFNKGKSTLVIYKIDTSHPNIKVTMNQQVLPGSSTPVNVVIPEEAVKDTGEVIYTVSLTTNAPSRPTINLLVYGRIK